MTTFNKQTLKTFFENGDVPTGQNYADFIDSNMNLVETAEQAMAGALKTTELITPRVSATNINITGILSAATLSVDNITTPSVTASAASITGSATIGGSLNVGSNISASTINVTGDVSAATGTIYVSAARTGTLFLGDGVVSAAGTAQATAAPLIYGINVGRGVVDGQTTGFGLVGNRQRQIQYLFNNGASANLWPPVGGVINGLAVNTPLALATSAMVTIVHIGASAYAVK